MKITKAVIAAAGFGTRFLPATKVIPKELLPLVDRPILQYLVEEAVNSGLEQVILILRPNTPLIRDYFSPKIEIEDHLVEQGKTELLNSLKKIGRMAQFTFIDQEQSLPYGTGAPLVSMEKLIAPGESFAFMFGDDLFKAEVPATRQLLAKYEEKPGVYLGCQQVPLAVVNRYGMVKFKDGSGEEVEGLVEKPKVDETPSTLASFGRFILNREILDILIRTKDSVAAGREFYLTDAITSYAAGNRVYATKLEGLWLTTGDPLNWLKANVEYARENVAGFDEYLKQQ